MNDEERLYLAEVLRKIEGQMDSMDQAQNTPQEGEIISTGNKILARMLEEFGVEVVKVEAIQNEASDRYDYLRHKTALEFMEKNAVEKSKSMARTSDEVTQALKELRSLENSVAILKTKAKSFWAYLDNSRSRLSWIGKDRSG